MSNQQQQIVTELTAALATERAANAEKQRHLEGVAESVQELAIALGDVMDAIRKLAVRWYARPVRAQLLAIAERAEAVLGTPVPKDWQAGVWERIGREFP